MAMNIGQSESANGDPDVMVEMNTTPLIDVMLVLLVMLIITIPIQLHAVNVDMPVQGVSDQTEPPKPIIIDIKSKNQIFWDNKPVADQSSLEALMRVEAQKAEQLEIHFKPDRVARYEDVARVMATAQRLGLQKIGMSNIDEFAPQAKTK